MLTTKLLVTTREALIALEQLTSWADSIKLAYAWASSDRGAAAHWKALPLAKVSRAVIGTHFAQTEPFVLRELRRCGVLRVFADIGGVFHPKVMVGSKGTERRALVGSSNFTASGFGANRELNLLLEGAAHEEAVAGIERHIDELWADPQAFAPDNTWFEQYERIHGARPEPQQVPQGPKALLSADLEIKPSWFTPAGGGHGISLGVDVLQELRLEGEGTARMFVAGAFIAEGALNAANSGRLTKVTALFEQLGITKGDVGRFVSVTVEEDAEGRRLSFERPR